MSRAHWQQPADIKAQYGSATILKNRRAVFNIKGNDRRLVMALADCGLAWWVVWGLGAGYPRLPD